MRTKSSVIKGEKNSALKVLILDNNKISSKIFEKIIHYFQLSKNITILPDQSISSMDQVSNFLQKNSHHYLIILKANLSFSRKNIGVSYDGIHLLQMIYENCEIYKKDNKPIIVSYLPLNYLKNMEDPVSRLLLKDEALYNFNQLPLRLDRFYKVLKEKGV